MAIFPKVKVWDGDDELNINADGSLPITDNGGSLTVDDGGSSITVDGTVTVQDGGNVISVDDAGGSITVDGSVSVSALTPGTGATDLGKAEDAGHTSGDTGVMLLAVRNDNHINFASTTLDYSPISVTSNGAINISDNASTISVDDGGGVLSIDDNGGSLTVDGALSVDDGGGSLTVDGTVAVSSLSGTSAVNLTQLAGNTISSGNGTSGTGTLRVSIASDSTGQVNAVQSGTWNVGTVTTITNVVHIDDNASTISIDDGAGSITVDGSVSISSITPGTTSTSLGKAEDAAHTSGDTGIMTLGVRNDNNISLSSTDLDYTPIAVNSAGAIAINDGGNSITVDGTVTTKAYSSGGSLQSPPSSNGAGTPLSVSNTSTVVFEIVDGSPSFVGTINFEVAILDSTYFPLEVVNITNGNTLCTSTTTTGLYIANIAKEGATVRARISNYVSGNTNVIAYFNAFGPDPRIQVIKDGGGSITVDGTLAATQSGNWTVDINAESLPLPTGAAQEHITPGSAHSVRLSNGTSFYKATTPSDTQPVSAASLPLPSGASTAAKQPAIGIAGTASADVITVQGITSMTPLKTDGSGFTQPVSGTITANIGTAGTLALDATLTGGTQKTKLVDTGGSNVASISAAGALKVDGSAVTQPVSGTFWQATQPISGTISATQSGTWNIGTVTTLTSLDLAQGSTTSGQTGPLVQTATTTAAPTYVTGKTNPLSTTTTGALRVDGSGATQPVSGTVAATQSGTWTVQPGNTANTTAWKVDGSAVTQPVSGTFWQATQPVSGTVTANAGTGTFTVSDAALELSQASTTSGQKGILIQGATTTAAPTYTTGQTNPISLTTAGAVRVDNSAVTQPVSGTVSAAQSGTWNITNISGTITLPTGAATAAKQPALGTAGAASADVITVQGIASMTALKVDGSAVTQPVSGTVTANQGGSNWSTNVAQINGVTPLMGNGATGTGALRVSIANDSTGIVALTTSSAQIGHLEANQSVNMAQINGVTTTTGNGVSGTGVQRVTLASDSTGQITLAAGSNTIGALTANQSINTNQIGGVSISAGNGVSGTGVQRVTIASDSTGVIGLNTGTNSIGKISDITTSVVPGTSSSHLGKAEDAAHVSGDTGVFILGVRNDANAALTSTDGDYSPIAVDSAGRLGVQTHAVSQSGTWNIGTVTTVTGITNVVHIDDNAGSLTVDGSVTANIGTTNGLALDATLTGGTLKSIVRGGAKGATTAADVTSTSVDADHNALDVYIKGGSSSGTQYAEDAAHVSGDIGTLTLAVRNDSQTVLTSTNGDYSPIAVDSAGRVQISDGAGSLTVDGTVTITSGTAATDLGKAEDAAHTSGDTGVMLLGVRNDSQAAFSSTNLDYTPIAVDSAGRVQITDGAGSITVDGTVAATQSGTWNVGTVTSLTSLDLAQGSTTSGQTGPLIQTATTASAPSYTTGKTNPLSTTSSGSLRTLDATLFNVSVASISGGAGLGSSPVFAIGAVPVIMQNLATANGDGTSITTQGRSTAVLNITASVAMSGGTTINFEVSPNGGTDWYPILGTQVGTTTTATSTTTTGSWQFNPSGYTDLRARISAYSAGTITITGYSYLASGSPVPITAVGINSGTNSIGKISDITTSIVPGTGNTHLGKAEDAAHTSGDTGIMMLGVRNDFQATLSGTNLDYTPISLTSSGLVQVHDGAGTISIDDDGGSISIDDGGTTISIDDANGSITIDGAVSILGNTAVISTGVTPAQETNRSASILSTDSMIMFNAPARTVTIKTSPGSAILYFNFSGVASSSNFAIDPGASYTYQGAARSSIHLIGASSTGTYSIHAY
jgi:hypothetical protein